MIYVTEKQEAIVLFIQKFISERGFAPTGREIADAFGFRSSNSARDHLLRLQKRGVLEWSAAKGRTLRILSEVTTLRVAVASAQSAVARSLSSCPRCGLRVVFEKGAPCSRHAEACLKQARDGLLLVDGVGHLFGCARTKGGVQCTCGSEPQGAFYQPSEKERSKS